MENGSKLSLPVSLPGSISIAASSSQNSFPGGSFMDVINTDMKKALRGGYTCVPTLTDKGTKNSIFTNFVVSTQTYVYEKDNFLLIFCRWS